MSAPASSERQRNDAAARPDIAVEITVYPPVFLVGERTDRSGLARLLDGRQRISCAPDNDLLTDLAALVRRSWPTLGRYGYPEQYWFRRIALFFDAIQVEYASSRQMVRWVVSADPVDLALIDRLFPRCQVVRVLSERRPSRSSTRTAADLGSRPLSTRYYQVTATDLRRDPEATLAGVLAFLDAGLEVRSRP
jgi:hypothetical protein